MCARTTLVILGGPAILACITPARPAVAMEWSDAMVLDINAESDGNVDDYYPRLATDGHGNWVVVWDAYNHFVFPWGSDHDLIFMRSNDDEVTWSAPAVLNSHALIDGAARDEKPMIEATPNGLWLNIRSPPMTSVERSTVSVIFRPPRHASPPTTEIMIATATSISTTCRFPRLPHRPGGQD